METTKMIKLGYTIAFVLVAFAVSAHAQQSPISVEQFEALDAAGKRKALYDLTISGAALPIETLVDMVRIAAQHEAPDVRIAAMVGVTVRALQSRWAGTTGPGLGPPPPGMPPRAPAKLIPLEWRTDRDTLRKGVFDLCLSLLRADPVEDVRHAALQAIGHIELPEDGSKQPLGEEFVSLLVEVYRRDSGDRLPADVVKTFRLTLNNDERIRALLRDSLIHPSRRVRYEALAAITPPAVGGRVKLSFDEARSTILAGTQSSDPGIRQTAVQALNEFGAAAIDEIPLLERLQTTDSDPAVRNSARLAIQAIRRALAR